MFYSQCGPNAGRGPEQRMANFKVFLSWFIRFHSQKKHAHFSNELLLRVIKNGKIRKLHFSNSIILQVFVIRFKKLYNSSQ